MVIAFYLPPVRIELVKITEAHTAEELAEAAENLDREAVALLSQVTPLALSGSTEASTAFVRTIRRYVDEVVAEIDPQGPLSEGGVHEALLYRSLSSPMTGWAAHFGFGKGIAASVAATALEMTSQYSAIAAPSGIPIEVGLADVGEFQRRVSTTLRLSEDPLVVITRELDLSKNDLGHLFGVSRQAASEWVDKGVPASRLREVSAVLRTVSSMSRKLKPGRLSLVARRPAAALGGRTLLEALTEDPEGTQYKVEDALDWSGPA